MKNGVKTIAFTIVFFGIGILYAYKYLDEFPSHTHAWAQADRYALSLGFIDNGMNFFTPQTFLFNHQFPDDWETASNSSITAVDFPIHDYIPALLMKISGIKSPVVFRLYILLYSFLGLFFLFRLVYILSNNYYKAFLIVVFAATSPVFVYYQSGFLPTIPSLSNAIIGIYFYYRFLTNSTNKDFYFSVFFLTLAGLSRTTFTIPLIAIICNEILRIFRKRAVISNRYLSLVISFVVIIFYVLYNSYLRTTYGSIFLNHILLPTSFQNAIEILKSVYDNWFYEYFTEYHYLFGFLALCVMAYFSLKRTVRLEEKLVSFVSYIVIIVLGCLIFAVLMLRQFTNHDYYFLDTFFLPIVLILAIIISFIPPVQKKNIKLLFSCILGLFVAILVIQPIFSQKERRYTGYWDRTEIMINNFQNSSAFLDSLDIPEDSRILVLDVGAPNIPFILMGRKGYFVPAINRESIQRVLKWDYDYIVYQDEFFISDIYSEMPEIINGLEIIADNGHITICKYSKSNIEKSLIEFLGLNDRVPVFEEEINFEGTHSSIWQNTDSTDKFSFSGQYSGILGDEQTYGLTLKMKELPEITTAPRTLFFSSQFLQIDSKGCEIITSITQDGKNIFYKTYNLKELIKEVNTWNSVNLIIQLPQVQSYDYEIDFFLWNTEKKELYYDDFSLKLY